MGNLIRGPFTEPESEDDAYDRWRQEMDDNGLDTGFRGRELWRDGLSSKFKKDKVSETPRTDAQVRMVSQLAPQTQTVPANLARQLERELRAAEERIAQLTASGEYFVCGSKKMGEYDMLVCCRTAGHAGEHNYVVAAAEGKP